MSRAPFIVIDGRLYRWKDILELRRAQLAAASAAQANQLALFATLHCVSAHGHRMQASGASNKGPVEASRMQARGALLSPLQQPQGR
jgi:hypothetical protein